MATEDAPVKRPRFSIEPDLVVEVEDEIFEVRSHTLMVASDVFMRMLTTDMREGCQGRVKLPGKSKDEFRELLLHLDVRGGAAPPKVTKENVPCLLRWASEYQMEGLKGRCEEFLMTEEPSDLEALKIALDFGLEKRCKQCTDKIAQRIFNHRNGIREFASHANVMREILPQIYAAVGLNLTMESSASVEVDDVWPLVVRAMEAMRGWRTLRENEQYSERARSLEKLLWEHIPQESIFDDDELFAEVPERGLTEAEVRAITKKVPGCRFAMSEVEDMVNIEDMMIEVEDMVKNAMDSLLPNASLPSVPGLGAQSKEHSRRKHGLANHGQ